jgi:hypothetical protein
MANKSWGRLPLTSGSTTPLAAGSSTRAEGRKADRRGPPGRLPTSLAPIPPIASSDRTPWLTSSVPGKSSSRQSLRLPDVQKERGGKGEASGAGLVLLQFLPGGPNCTESEEMSAGRGLADRCNPAARQDSPRRVSHLTPGRGACRPVSAISGPPPAQIVESRRRR